jgi:hypothetical protein
MMPGDSSGTFDAEMLLKIGAMEATQEAMEDKIDKIETRVAGVEDKLAGNTTILLEIKNGLAAVLASQESHEQRMDGHSEAIERLGSDGYPIESKQPFFSKKQRELLIKARDKAIMVVLTALFVAAIWYGLNWAASQEPAP